MPQPLHKRIGDLADVMMNTETYFAIDLSMLLALLVIILVTVVVQLHRLKNARHTGVCSTPEPALQQVAQLPREVATSSADMQRPNTTLNFNDSYALCGRTQLKIPDFYDSDPLLWFKVVEASLVAMTSPNLKRDMA